jgi:undecaprenyl-phosphate 4-deoxy-4-formamido-L-arabinose transferase
MIQYSVIIPVYNGETTVEPLFERLKSFFEASNFSFEVIFVYDCGKDNSWKVLLKLKNDYPANIKLIKLSRNFGQHNALICGFDHTMGEFVITMDEDLQHAPEDIAKLIVKQKESDFDVVYGKYEELKHSVVRNTGSRILKRIIAIGIPELHPDYSAFRLIKSTVAKSTVEMKNSYTFLDGYLSWITTHVGSCFVSHSERQGGVSAYTFKKLVNHTINIFVTFSDLPIRFLSKFSIALLIGMSVFSIYVITRKLLLDDFAMGYPSLILAIGFGVGLIMLSLGIIGEYIYRINLKTTKRPNYNIDKIL